MIDGIIAQMTGEYFEGCQPGCGCRIQTAYNTVAPTTDKDALIRELLEALYKNNRWWYRNIITKSAKRVILSNNQAIESAKKMGY